MGLRLLALSLYRDFLALDRELLLFSSLARTELSMAVCYTADAVGLDTSWRVLQNWAVPVL